MAALSEFLALHDNVRRSGDGFVMRCRAHEDRENSLSAKQADGKILAHCFAGCETESIVAAISWSLKDLFLEPKSNGARLVRRSRPSLHWEIKDTDGQVVAIHERVETPDGKTFVWRRPDGKAGLNGTPMSELPLYGSELASTWRVDEPIVVTEGEKAADAVRTAGLASVGTVCGSSSTPGDGALSALIGCDVVLWPDADDGGRAHMERVAQRLAPFVSSLRIVDWPDAPPKGDAANAFPPRIRELVTSAEPYGQAEPIDGSLAEALDAVLAHLRRFVSFSDPAQPIAVALWVAHTHVYDRGETSPILWIRSAAPQSGKTRLIETIEHLVQRPWKDMRPSEAVLYRRTHRDHPTLLLDEVDAVFKDKSNQFEGLRAFLNAGNRRGVTVSRWNQARNDLDSFEVFTPKAIAGLGSVPDTVATRAIPVVMQRRSKAERIERLRERKARELGAPLRDALAAHVRTIEALHLPDEALPDELGDRQQDSWEPLLAIADAAGGQWPEQARKAAIALHVGTDTTDEQDYGIRLLADTRVIFTTSTEPWLKTTNLIDELVKFDESPWGDLRGRALSSTYLAKLLRPFGIKPKHKRVGTETQRGYVVDDFADAWLRYLPTYPDLPGTPDTHGTQDRVPVPGVPSVPGTQGLIDTQLTTDVAR